MNSGLLRAAGGATSSEWEAIVLTQPVVLCPRTALAAPSFWTGTQSGCSNRGGITEREAGGSAGASEKLGVKVSRTERVPPSFDSAHVDGKQWTLSRTFQLLPPTQTLTFVCSTHQCCRAVQVPPASACGL
ncbi:hypothetical protein JEQ12_000031 [Ovis aries]|uniref:Uncharacterized protein n=1 Tax=Ovis aries TaxID=9940 RepID=A0A836ANI9_SHEEP|nr:hypothetical protein JEQ12_000031 [Ovis aries]